MSKNQDSSSQAEWAKRKLEDIRAKIGHSDQFKRAADRMIEALAANHENWAFAENGVELLSLIIDEAHKGVDIAKRYPSIFQKMVEDEELRQLFLDALSLLEIGEKDEIKPLSDKSQSQGLEFLKSQYSPATVELTSRDTWQVRWQRTTNQLQTILSPSSLAYRSDINMFEDSWITLLRDEVEIQDLTVTIILEGNPSESLEALDLILKLAITDVTMQKEQLPKMSASLHWGGYEETAQIGEHGTASFTPVSLENILDDTKQNVIAGLELYLEATQG